MTPLDLELNERHEVHADVLLYIQKVMYNYC